MIYQLQQCGDLLKNFLKPSVQLSLSYPYFTWKFDLLSSYVSELTVINWEQCIYSRASLLIFWLFESWQSIYLEPFIIIIWIRIANNGLMIPFSSIPINQFLIQILANIIIIEIDWEMWLVYMPLKWHLNFPYKTRFVGKIQFPLKLVLNPMNFRFSWWTLDETWKLSDEPGQIKWIYCSTIWFFLEPRCRIHQELNSVN